MEFIKVNGKILDCRAYKEDVRIIRKVIALDLKEYFARLGFETNGNTFYNSQLDLEIKVFIEKRNPEVPA
jgi:hypothetical protein